MSRQLTTSVADFHCSPSPRPALTQDQRVPSPFLFPALRKLFKEIGPRFATRPGGYTRIIKRQERRLGDAGRTAFIEFLKEGETKVQARTPAPAPRVTEPTSPAETPPPTPPPTASQQQPQTPPPEQQAPSTPGEQAT